MTSPRACRPNGGFTLTELLIVVALIGIIVALSGPPLADYVRVQRLKGISAALATDLAFARSESVSRGVYVDVRVQAGSGMSCYVIYVRPSPVSGVGSPSCDCTAAAGSRCTDPTTVEVRTVQVPQDTLVSVAAASTNPTGTILTINPRTGGVYVFAVAESAGATDFSVDARLDSTRALRTTMLQSGLIKGCLTPGAAMTGVAPC